MLIVETLDRQAVAAGYYRRANGKVCVLLNDHFAMFESFQEYAILFVLHDCCAAWRSYCITLLAFEDGCGLSVGYRTDGHGPIRHYEFAIRMQSLGQRTDESDY